MGLGPKIKEKYKEAREKAENVFMQIDPNSRKWKTNIAKRERKWHGHNSCYLLLYKDILEGKMEVVLKLKDPAYGNNKDAWSLIWNSLDLDFTPLSLHG